MNDKTLTSPRVVIGVAIALVVVVSLLVRESPSTRKTAPEEPAPRIPAAAREAGTLDPDMVAAWRSAATRRGLDLERYEPIYLQDPRNVTVLLLPKGSEDIPSSAPAPRPEYEIIVERGSNRIMGFAMP